MQQDCVASNLACLPCLDFTSFFLPHNDPMYDDFSSLDMVVLSPYSCNGGGAIGAMAAATAGGNQEIRRGGDERKRRRLASNRESARRSRVRKQRRLDDLSAQVAELLGTNQKLLIELNRVMVKHARMVRENAKLREEAEGLQKRLSEIMEVEEDEDEAAPAENPEVAELLLA